MIKQWLHLGEDYETLSVFFTKDFIATNNAATGKFGFLVQPTTYVLPLSAAEEASITASFRFLQQKYHTPHPQRENIVKNIITSLLYEIAGLYDQRPVPLGVGKPRSQVLSAEFKQLVQTHSASARSVAFYAGALRITPRHLTELVKEVTGKTPSDWIAEAVVLEAKVLLQNPALPIQ
ncbi:helix-turn-helix domain-containing protein [Hymenobacter elongatus]|uniref:helix-turn-helix domain-containing protein n=1 Tax=Hymenobacter elongatus TaxID=877208 RepID=UPI001AEC0199|nr:helix-turn-helix domain-containing protein [Hymenobacter elongatus]